jgi:hypothetical protein
MSNLEQTANDATESETVNQDTPTDMVDTTLPRVTRKATQVVTHQFLPDEQRTSSRRIF